MYIRIFEGLVFGAWKLLLKFLKYFAKSLKTVSNYISNYLGTLFRCLNTLRTSITLCFGCSRYSFLPNMRFIFSQKITIKKKKILILHYPPVWYKGLGSDLARICPFFWRYRIEIQWIWDNNERPGTAALFRSISFYNALK